MRERPGTLAEAGIALVDIAMDAIGDTGIADMPVGQPEALGELGRCQRAPFRQEGLPMRPDGPGLVQELVINARQRTIAG